MKIPENLFYTVEHEWLRIDDNLATIGITDFAQSELGDIVFIEFPDLGQNFEKGDVLGTIEAVKTVADLFAPISGEIIEINDSLENSPDDVNSDAYGNGWLVKIKISDIKECDDLLNSAGYKELLS